MLDYRVKIGLVPIRRSVTPRPGIFSWEKTEERYASVVAYIEEHFSDEQVSFVDLERINPANVLYCERDVNAVVERMKQEKVDAIFLINGNFDNEEVAAMVTRGLEKPVLLREPRDKVPLTDRTRYADNQCGLLGMSRQPQELNISFTYIENCRMEEDTSAEGLKRFVPVACMVKNFRRMWIVQVGMQPKPSCSIVISEGELMQKFGITVVLVNMAMVVKRSNWILEEHGGELEEGAKPLVSRYEPGGLTAPMLKKIYVFVLLFRDIFEEYWAGVISAECRTAMQLGVGAMPCVAYSVLTDMGCVISCESDLHRTVTMSMLVYAFMGKRVLLFGEFTARHPEDENTELLQYCGPFVYPLEKEGSPAKQMNIRQWFEVKDGTYTVTRIDQDNGGYRFLAGVCESAEGPYILGVYLWAKSDSLFKQEYKLVKGSYIHHMAEIEGGYAEVIREPCKHVPNLEPDWVEQRKLGSGQTE